jgi:carbonic anhydrase
MSKTNLPGPEALQRLIQGNRRYTQNVRSVDSMLSHSRRDMQSQLPFAIILGCSDSRAPAEVVFDQGLGDLFVIRVAGNIVAPSQIGSVEFAAERFGTRLVVVMGHTGCGAIDATLEAIAGGAPASRNLLSIVDRVRPSLEALANTELARDPERLKREAIRANVRASVSQLRNSSPILEQLMVREDLLIVGAELELATGEVNYFDGVPAQAGASTFSR